MNERVSKIIKWVTILRCIITDCRKFDNFYWLILSPIVNTTFKIYTYILAASNNTLQLAHTSAGRPPTSTGRTERPGSPLHGHGQRECAEGGVNVSQRLIQSRGSIASQVLMTASHVSSHSCVSLHSDNSHWCGCHSRDHDSITLHPLRLRLFNYTPQLTPFLTF